MKIIPLTQGYFAIVSDKDFDYLMKFSWQIKRNKDGSLWARRGSLKSEHKNNRQYGINMHTVIANRMKLIIPKNGYVDHKDRNGLNNQRENLRPATRSQNKINQKKYKNNTSGYIGVIKRNKFRYESRISHNGKRENLGYYTTGEMAAKVRDHFAKLYFGEFAILNFPEEK